MTNDIIAELITAWREIANEMRAIAEEVRKTRMELEKCRQEVKRIAAREEEFTPLPYRNVMKGE